MMVYGSWADGEKPIIKNSNLRKFLAAAAQRGRGLFSGSFGSVLFIILSLAIISLCVKLLGLWGLLVAFILIGMLKLFLAGEHIYIAMQNIESKIWGRPLDKIYWQDRKLPKVKLIWRKKENGKRHDQ